MKTTIFSLLFFSSFYFVSAQNPVSFYQGGINGPKGYMVYKNGKYDTIVKAKYFDASVFKDGLAKVSLGKRNDTTSRYGYIRTDGTTAIPLIYMDAWDFNDGLALAAKGATFSSRKYGYLDKNGREAIPFIYDEARKMNEGIAAVKHNGKWKLIDKTGKKLAQLDFQFVGTFYEGLAKGTKRRSLGLYKQKWEPRNTC